MGGKIRLTFFFWDPRVEGFGGMVAWVNGGEWCDEREKIDGVWEMFRIIDGA